MNIQELTIAMHRFVSSQGWYESGSMRPQTLRNLAISLNLEAAEVLEHFQWQEEGFGPAKKTALFLTACAVEILLLVSLMLAK